MTTPFAYAGGSTRVLSEASTAAGAGCTYVGTLSSTEVPLPVDPSLLTAVIFLEWAGSDQGWVDVLLVPGTYFMQIESDCSWTVSIGSG